MSLSCNLNFCYTIILDNITQAVMLAPTTPNSAINVDYTTCTNLGAVLLIRPSHAGIHSSLLVENVQGLQNMNL
jgi:hypothetical protein